MSAWRRAVLIALLAVGLRVAPVSAGPPVAPVQRGIKAKEWVLKGALYTNRDANAAAAYDTFVLSQKMAPEDLRFIRYLSLHNIPSDYRQSYYDTSTFVLNSCAGLGLQVPAVSIVKPAWGGPENILIRVDLYALGISPSAWDSMADKEPYFHQAIIRTEVITHLQHDNLPPYIGPDGKEHTAVKTWVETSEPKRLLATSAMLNSNDSMWLVDRLQTVAPIYRADWFIRNALLEPNYRRLLGVKNLKDIKKLAFFDERSEIFQNKGTVVTSGSDGLCARVAQNNRILQRRRTIIGYWWETFDFKTSIGGQNIITNFLQEKRDAAEFIFTLPNGLQGYAITNEKDELIDAGDTNIVIDTMGHDGIVKNGRSCVWCHAGGINPFKSQFQKQVGYDPSQADLGIFQQDPKNPVSHAKALYLAEKIKNEFGAPDFDKVVKADNELYSRKIKECNGMDATENGLQFKKIWEDYDVELIDMEHAVFEAGIPEAELRELLGLRLNGRSDEVLIQLVVNPPIGIRRDHFEEHFLTVALLYSLKHPLTSQGSPPPPVAPETAPVKGKR